MSKFLNIFWILALALVIGQMTVMPTLAFAQGDCGKNTTSNGNQLPNPLCVGSITELLNNIIKGLLVIAIPIVTIMVLYGAFLIMSSAGDPGKIETGKKTILYAAIGFAILLIANGITFIVKDLLGYTGK